MATLRFIRFLVYPLIATVCNACIQSLDEWKQIGVEERAKRSPIVFHGLAIEAIPGSENLNFYSVTFWMINVYKGAEDVALLLKLDPGSGGVFNLRDRRVNVTGFGDESNCHNTVAPQKYYIIFCEVRKGGLVAKFDDLFGAAVEWSEKNEERVWHGIGWEDWTDWGACSASCGEGTQERIRKPTHKQKRSRGYNKERRRCNMFSCQGAVDPLKLNDTRFFYVSRGEWERVPGRPTAWKLRPNSYVWVPSSQVFPKPGSPRAGMFPREFTLLVTLKLHPSKPVQGTLFSLRSRQQQDAYLSLELEAEDRIRIVHAGKNGTQAVVIPMELNDGHWHQLGLALQDDNSVRSFLDCAWVSTDILKRNGLNHPEDADLVVGYLFQGYLEQFVIVPNPSAVAQQCSTSRIPLNDPTIEKSFDNISITEKMKRFKYIKINDDIRKKSLNHLKRKINKRNEIVRGNSKQSRIWEKDKNNDVAKQIVFESDEDSIEGSGDKYGTSATTYEVELSDWSDCSVSCGPGIQSRFSRCVDDGSQLELCMEAGGEKTETRSCFMAACTISEESPQIFSFDSDFSQKKLIQIPLKSVSAMNISSNKSNFSYGKEENSSLIDHNFFKKHIVMGNKYHQHKYNSQKSYDSQLWNFVRKKLLKRKVSCRTKCLNKGSCVRPDQCECPHSVTSNNCQNPICEPPCENGATCFPGNWCLCDSNFYGIRCERRKCEYQPVREPFTRGFRRLLSKKTNQKCALKNPDRCSQNIPEYQTVYKTFYRTMYKCKQNGKNKEASKGRT